MNTNNHDELIELRESLADNYSASDLESASEEELQDMKADIELYEFLDEEVNLFKESTIQTKEQLIASVRETKAKYQKEASSNKSEHTLAFYEILNSLLNRFEVAIRGTLLPEPLNDWWCYSYEITDIGINLLMNHFSWSHDYGRSYSCWRDEAFVMLEIPAKLLTVSEYAEAYGVQPVTVRQWIRRAKLRNVVKVGREWRIPELTEKPEARGYLPCKYSWSEVLTDLPEKYSFLSEFKFARFWQDEKNDNRFCVQFITDIGNEKYNDLFEEEDADPEDFTTAILGIYPNLTISEKVILLLTAKEREELEMYMIGNPLIRCTSIKSRTGALAYSIAEFGDGDYDGVSVDYA